jgi:uncharacterized membrane protein
MIYYALKTLPIIFLFKEDQAEIVDRATCENIIACDDILSTEDADLFMQILYILDFLYYTVIPALVTLCGFYILNTLCAMI